MAPARWLLCANRMRTAIVITLVHLSFSILARADWVKVLPGSVSRVVASGRNSAVIRDQEVLVLREDGRVISRIGAAQVAGNAGQGPSLKDAAERTLDRLEVPEIERGTDYTDDLVEDESRLHERRFWRKSLRASAPSLPFSRLALSASMDAIWIASRRGIFRVGEAGTIAPAFGRQWTGSRIAAANDRIVVDKGNALALLSTTEAEPQVVELASPAEQFAISASGERMAWTTNTVVHIVSALGSASMDAPGEIVHLTFCGETLIALLASNVLAIPPEGRAEIRSAPLHARKLFCPSGPEMPWVAIGDGLWVSSDQSQQWMALPAPRGATLVDAAVSDCHLWLASPDGLYLSLSVDATVADDTSRENVRPVKAHGRSRAAWWVGLMPNVSVRAAATFAPTGSRLEGFAFAAFPLGSQAIRVAAVNLPEDITIAEPVRSASIDLRDADSNCLTLARRKAVELAMSEPERARSYVTRAGNAAWLPELRVLVSRRYGRSESLDVDSSSSALSSPLGIDTVNDIRYEARATWDLGRLVFSSEELAAQAQALHMAELRRDIETTINRLYFERRRLAIASSRESLVRVGEVEAELDAMSAGSFGTCVSEKSVGAR